MKRFLKMKRFFKFLVIHLIIHILLHLLGFSFYEILLLSLFLVVVDDRWSFWFEWLKRRKKMKITEGKKIFCCCRQENQLAALSRIPQEPPQAARPTEASLIVSGVSWLNSRQQKNFFKLELEIILEKSVFFFF